MKEVMIILRPKMYFPTKDALDQAGFHSMTIREICNLLEYLTQ